MRSSVISGVGAEVTLHTHSSIASPTTHVHAANQSDGLFSHWPGSASHGSSFATCPAPHIQALDAQAPACLEGGRECESLPERAELKAFARSIDQSLKESLETTKEARKRFERRVCDYRYAEIEECRGAVEL
eukprot:symbB.v1.2.016015.t1/scaffold1206.1/size131539/5